LSPNLRSTEAFVLHEGTAVQVLDTVENWKKIKLSDGKTGWVMMMSIVEEFFRLYLTASCSFVIYLSLDKDKNA
jgi:SH3-like domain-containing protein